METGIFCFAQLWTRPGSTRRVPLNTNGGGHDAFSLEGHVRRCRVGRVHIISKASSSSYAVLASEIQAEHTCPLNCETSMCSAGLSPMQSCLPEAERGEGTEQGV